MIQWGDSASLYCIILVYTVLYCIIRVHGHGRIRVAGLGRVGQGWPGQGGPILPPRVPPLLPTAADVIHALTAAAYRGRERVVGLRKTTK